MQAPGIPDRGDEGDVSKIQAGELLDLIIQRHQADRAGKEHRDIRIGSPEHGLLSWATKHGLPETGEPRQLFQQPLHSHEYGSFEGQIPAGSYGAGRVELERKDKVLITARHPDGGFSFTTAGGSPTRYRMIPPKEGKGWLIARANDPEAPQHVKDKMRSVDPDTARTSVENWQNVSRVQPKIDGALHILKMLDDRPEIYSHRTSRRTGKPIVHTERVLGQIPRLDVPPDLRKEFLGETYGVDEQGKAIPLQQLSGLLNSSIGRSLSEQKEKRIKLITALHDIAGDTRPYDEKLVDMRRLSELMPGKVEVTEDVTDRDKALELLKQIQEGKHPKTREGYILRDQQGNPTKAKFRPEHDVWIRDTFPGEGKYQDQPGGFLYSHEPEGPIVGRVGTGFDDQTRKTLADYVGRVARVESPGQHLSGALREPSFVAVHEDYSYSPRIHSLQKDNPSVKNAHEENIPERDQSVQILDGHEAAMPEPKEPSVQILRGEGDNHLGTMAKRLQTIHAGHGRMPGELFSGSNRCERELHPGKLPLAGSKDTESQCTQQCVDNLRRDNIMCDGVGGAPEHLLENDKKSSEGWLGRGENVRSTPSAGSQSVLKNFRKELLCSSVQDLQIAQKHASQTAEDAAYMGWKNPDECSVGTGVECPPANHVLLEEPGVNYGSDSASNWNYTPMTKESARSDKLDRLRDRQGKCRKCGKTNVGENSKCDCPPEKCEKCGEPNTGYYDVRNRCRGCAGKEASEHKTVVCFDLDGTLATKQEPFNPKTIGEPIPKMIAKLRKHLDNGDTCVIFTARAHDGNSCTPVIHKWLEDQGLPKMEVTNEKRPAMSLFYDDKAISVKADEGTTKQATQFEFQEALNASDIPGDVQFYTDGNDRCTIMFGDWHEPEVWDQAIALAKEHFTNFEEPDDSEIGRPAWVTTSLSSDNGPNDCCQKQGSVIERLHKAKKHSDAGQYTSKHVIIRQLLTEAPEDFAQSSDDETHPGIVHIPSGFRMHVPRHLAAMATGEKQASELKEPIKRPRIEHDDICPNCNEEIREKGAWPLRNKDGKIVYMGDRMVERHSACQGLFVYPESKSELTGEWAAMAGEGRKSMMKDSVQYADWLKEQPEIMQTKQASVAEARKATNTEPSDAQIDAGNYAKGKFRWNGMRISLENPKGSTRSGTSKSGKKWSTLMRHDYGYFLGTIGKDKDHVDVFVGPYPDSEIAFVIDQQCPDSGKFDEHKVVIGARTEAEARKVYLDNYEDGWEGIGSITAMTVPQLKRWLGEGDQQCPLKGQQIKLSFEQMWDALGLALSDEHAKQAADSRMGLETVVGAATGGALGALVGALKAKAHNKALEEGTELGERQSLALNALGYGVGGAALGGGTMAALSLLRSPDHGKDKDDNRPFFEHGKAQRQMVVPDWDKNKADGKINPEDYLSHWYQHVDGGWQRVKSRAKDAVRQAKGTGNQAVDMPGSRGSAVQATEDNAKARNISELRPGPVSFPGIKIIKGDVPDDSDRPFNYAMDVSKIPLIGKYLTHAGNVGNGFEAPDIPGTRTISAEDARNELLGHEARHQFQGEQPFKFKSPVEELHDKVYIGVGGELTQALGQLKAETAYLTGKLIQSGKDFRQLMDETGVTNPDPHQLKEMEKQYTPEGARMLNYMRTVRMIDRDAYNHLIDKLDEGDVYNQVAATGDFQNTKMASAVDVPLMGPEAVSHALKNMNLDDLEQEQRAILAKGAKTKRPHAVRILGIIQGLRRNELEPKDLMITKVPLLPPAFRPFNVVGQTFVPGDANELYKDLDSYRKSYHQTKSELGEEGAKDAWHNLRQAVKAVYGHADSPNPKTAGRNVSGFLSAITGNRSKYGFVQRRLLSKPQDSVARGTIIPDPELNMNRVGLPHDAAWPAYSSHVQRRLVRGGMSPMDALKNVRDRSANASKALELEMGERPVLLSRAPSWHKYNVVASWPHLVEGDAIRISPMIATGMNADYDGDAQLAHIQLLRRKTNY